jgi:uncharacterized membrane protein HdeD (DUF308 family)
MEGKVHAWLETAKKNAGWLMVLGFVELVAGVLSITGPFVVGLAVAVAVGIALLLAGSARLVGAFMADSFGAGALIFGWGLMIATTGFYFMIRPGVGLETLTLVIAMVLFVDGVTKVVLSLHIKPVKGWGFMLAGGIFSTLFACTVGWNLAASSLWVIGTLVGFSLLMNGFTTITLAGTARQVAGAVAKAA